MWTTTVIPHLAVVKYGSLLCAMREYGVPVRGVIYPLLHPSYRYEIERCFNDFVVRHEELTTPPTNKGD